MHSKEEKLKSFNNLLDIMDELREKCPWDKVQTINTLRHLTIEEVYELSDTIIKNDISELKKELGDILLHIVFYSKIASETNDFDIKDVIDGLIEKLINRHPHIYGDTKVDNEQEVKENWEKLKLKEGRKSVLEGVPNSLPAMIKAYRIQEKVKGIGFEFENDNQILHKINEEIIEFEIENDKEKKELEFGDILFSLINYGRFNKINAEDALEKSNQKFITRFQKLENLIKKDNLIINEIPINELNNYWEKAKYL